MQRQEEIDSANRTLAAMQAESAAKVEAERAEKAKTERAALRAVEQRKVAVAKEEEQELEKLLANNPFYFLAAQAGARSDELSRGHTPLPHFARICLPCPLIMSLCI